MAKSTVTTSDELRVLAWEEKLYRDTIKEAYFSRFMGKSSDSLCQVKEELTKAKGDKITFGIRMRLTSPGVTSGQPLEGNEDKLTTHSFYVELERYRNAVRDDGALSRQRPVYDMDQEHRDALKDWGAEKIDQLAFDAILANPTKIFYGGAAAAYTDLTEADLITPALISKIKTWCITGGARAQTPLRPLKINGRTYFVLLVHPDVRYDLSRDSEWAQAAREALPRGTNNPLFDAAEYLWDGVLIHAHENIPIHTTWGAGTIAAAACTFMGAQSLVWAWGERPSVVSKEFDYEEEHGFAWRMTAKCGKPVFNTKDYGSVGVYVARTKISDA